MFSNPVFHQFLMLCFFGLVFLAALSDLREFRIPNKISLALLALYPLYVLSSPVPVAWLMALAIGSLVFAAGLTLFFCRLLGGGDVKFLAATSLWAGAGLTLPLLVVMGLGESHRPVFRAAAYTNGLKMLPDGRLATAWSNWLMP